MSVDFHKDGATAHVVLKNPPVNAIGLAVRQGLSDALTWVEGQTGLSRVILYGAGRAFAAGGDAKEFDTPPVAPHLPDIVARIEACRVPWIAAISGVALGGGCELALGCRYRIAAPDARIGLPEVTLGVVPGAGGTQRLPRLVGVGPALDLIATGKPVSAERAAEMGLVHAISNDPIRAAEELAPEILKGVATIGSLPAPAREPTAVAAARALAARKAAGQIAPPRAIDLVEAAATMPFADGMATERAAFLDLRQGEQARALRHMFFAERGARAPTWIEDGPGPLDKVAVIGGGTMGAGIAYALLDAGVRVTILETGSAGVERARANVEKIIASGLQRGLIDDAAAKDRRGRFDTSQDYASIADATLAIEAAFESMSVKTSIFSMLEAHLHSDAILATNTSYLDIDVIAAPLKDPGRVVGLHFFAPAHIMKLLEIVRGAKTGHRALATGFALAKRLGKVPVLAGVCDGFIGNRILARYREAADTLLMDGAMPWQIDNAMVNFGYAMGPYEAQDLSGLDIAHANRRRQDATRDPGRRYVPIADRMVEGGRLGRKTGAGWYCYPEGGEKVPDPGVADLIVAVSSAAGVTRRDFAEAEIRECLLLAMINEASDILGEGIAASAGDIDLVTVLGYGFPRWRGGLMHYADTLGPRRVLASVEKLAAEDPVAWRPSPVLKDCARTGRRLTEFRPAP